MYCECTYLDGKDKAWSLCLRVIITPMAGRCVLYQRIAVNIQHSCVARTRCPLLVMTVELRQCEYLLLVPSGRRVTTRQTHNDGYCRNVDTEACYLVPRIYTAT